MTFVVCHMACEAKNRFGEKTTVTDVTPMEGHDTSITCPVCGFQFRQGEARTTVCQQCPLRGACRFLIKCPNCGYEIPLVQAPTWLQWLISKMGSWVSKGKL